MKIYDTWEEDIPDYALPYLINADSSGLSPQEIDHIDNFMKYFYDKADSVNGSVVIDMTEEESFFTWNPAFGLACNCFNCTITILI